MSLNHIVPAEASVINMLGMLFGKGLTVKASSALPLDKAKQSFGVFIDNESQVVAVCICDFDFAIYAGAALSMIPPAGAKDALGDGELSDMMVSNLGEVMNICSRLFMDNKTPHLKLDKVYTNISQVPDAALAIADAPAGRSDFAIGIPRYGEGHLSFLAT